LTQQWARSEKQRSLAKSDFGPEGESNMTFALRSGESISKGLKRSLVSDLKRALREVDALNSEGHIHELRKRIKRMRALLRLVHQNIGSQAFHCVDARLQKAGKQLAELRDAEVSLTTLEGLKNDRVVRIQPKAVQTLLEQLATRHKAALIRLLGHKHRIRHIKQRLKESKRDVGRWKLGSGWQLIQAGIIATYNTSQNCLANAIADPSIEKLHSWRKEVKCLWHQMQFIHALHGRRVSRLEKRLHDLATALGDDHDLAILAQVVIDNREEVDISSCALSFATAAKKKRLKLQEQAFTLGRHLFQQSSEGFDRHLRNGKPLRRVST
jgi:CHAD domain-containing protein